VTVTSVIPADPVIVGPIVAATYRMQARPEVERTPFSGIKLMSFVARPQFARLASGDQLMVRYWLGVRPGVAVQVVDNGDDSITVWIVMNDVGYVSPPLPPSRDVQHGVGEIRSELPEVGEVIDTIRAGGAFSLNPLGNAILEKGFDTDSYQLATPVEPPLGPFIPVAGLQNGGTAQSMVSTSTALPYPVLGTIELKWERR
jgi:hypothetical protein